MNYSPQDIKQGVDLKKQAEENPSNFGILGGATERSASGVQGKSRMAGPVGARAISLLNDPAEQQRTADWMGKFGLSNQGMEFNQAKMGMSGMTTNDQEQQGNQ